MANLFKLISSMTINRRQVPDRDGHGAGDSIVSNDRVSGQAGFGDPVMKISIEGMTDIESAAMLQQKLIDALNSAEDKVDMDMSGVDRMDTTAIQMLISFCGMVAGKKEVTWSGLTGELEHTIRLFGAGELLGIGA